MKFEIKERGTKEYYDEVLYVAFRYMDFLKKPKRKVFKLTKFLLILTIITILFLTLSIYLYYISKDIFYIILIGLLSAIIFISFISFIIAKRRIKYFMSEIDTKIIDINNNGIEYIDESKNYRIKWEDIKNIIINKYSICFIPRTKILISIYIEYKSDVIKTLKKYHKEDLLIDNNFYKK